MSVLKLKFVWIMLDQLIGHCISDSVISFLEAMRYLIQKAVWITGCKLKVRLKLYLATLPVCDAWMDWGGGSVTCRSIPNWHNTIPYYLGVSILCYIYDQRNESVTLSCLSCWLKLFLVLLSCWLKLFLVLFFGLSWHCKTFLIGNPFLLSSRYLI